MAIYQAPLDPGLMEAAGFTGARAQQAVGSAQQKAAIQTNQGNLAGEQARQGILGGAESRGLLRSSMTQQDIGNQAAEQANRQQLIDLGVQDVMAGANIDVMQELARQQLQQEQAAQSRAIFDQQLAFKRQQLSQQPGGLIDWARVGEITGGAVTGPGNGFRPLYN